MSVLNTLPAPVIQMGLVEKIVDAQQNQPVVQQLVAQATTRQELKDAQSKVSSLESADSGKKVREREAGQGNANNPDSRADGRGTDGDRRPGDDAPASEPGNARTKPWSGHILNVKV